MPEDLTLEEKIMYIYCNLCNMFSYDDGYFYRDRIDTDRYTDRFSKEVLEGVKPDTKITCFEFARILSKFINQLDGDVESVVITEGVNRGHFKTGFYTDKVSVMLEAVNSDLKSGTNDFMKIKAGMLPNGIEIISDKFDIMKKAVDKVYPLVLDKKYTIDEYISDFEEYKENKPEEVNSSNIEKKLEAFCEILYDNEILGNEAVQTFNIFDNFDFFGSDIEKAYVGKKVLNENEETYKRYILVRARNEFKENPKEYSVYLLDTDTLELEKFKAKDFIEKIKSEEFVYENRARKLKGIDKEET